MLLYETKSKEGFTNLDTTFLPWSSPCSWTTLRAAGRTFQNSATNSFPFRLLFCRMAFARYKRGTFWTICALWNSLSHVATASSALLRWNMHQWDKAYYKVKATQTLSITSSEFIQDNKKYTPGYCSNSSLKRKLQKEKCFNQINSIYICSQLISSLLLKHHPTNLERQVNDTDRVSWMVLCAYFV